MLLTISTTVFVTLISGVVLALYLYCIRTYSYWSRHGIWQFPTSVPFGNAWPIIWKRKHMGDFFLDYYKQLKAMNSSVGGLYLFTKPILLIVDPDYVQRVLVTDFSHFRDRGIYCAEEIDPLSVNLLTLPGERWKHIRNKLAPFFTMNKLKLLFPTMEACGPNLIEMVSEYSVKNEPVNIKTMIWRFTCQILGSCIFGFECNTTKDPNDFVYQVGKDIFEPAPLEALKRPFFFLMPNILKTLRISSNSKFVTDFFFKLTKDTIEYREKYNVRRNDMMQILVDSRQKNVDGPPNPDDLTMNEIASQCMVFFAGGFDTASVVVSYCLYELSVNQDIQDKMREEINEVLLGYDGKFTFEAIAKMKYLECAVKETLRKYPALPFLNRECTKDYTFPNSDITLRKGDAVILSLVGMHRDADIYPDPETFDPDRFAEDSAKVNPYTYLPFGEGPRICVAYRFGLIQAKFTVATLVKHFRFTFNNKTKLPFEFPKNSFTMTVDGGMWLNAEKL